MDRENMEYKMRALHMQIFIAHKVIQVEVLKKTGHMFSFRDNFSNTSDLDTISAWQLEINIEIVFVKMFVFLEYLKKLEKDQEYAIDKVLLKAGLRPYVAHMGTEIDFRLLNLPISKLVIADKIEIVDEEIFFTLLKGDHIELISNLTPLKINLTEKLFNPHFEFIEANYPDWLS